MVVRHGGIAISRQCLYQVGIAVAMIVDARTDEHQGLRVSDGRPRLVEQRAAFCPYGLVLQHGLGGSREA